MKRESQKALNPKLRKLYDERIRNFAVTFSFLFSKAYDFVTNTFQKCLPHPRKLARLYESVNSQPAFSSEVLGTLQRKLSNHKLGCALMLDAMAIKKHVHWDGHKLVGHVDLGGGNSDDSSPLASQVLVFHLAFFNNIWKIPLGYFFTNSISGDQIYSLALRAVALLNEAEVLVATITFDGHASNIAAAKQLGYCTENVSVVNRTVSYEGQEMELMLVACHMLKLFRNTLHDLEQLY